jgi:hypothetical protein
MLVVLRLVAQGDRRLNPLMPVWCEVDTACGVAHAIDLD